MGKAQLAADIWYAVLSQSGYITYTSRSEQDAEGMANSTDDVIILENVTPRKNVNCVKVIIHKEAVDYGYFS